MFTFKENEIRQACFVWKGSPRSCVSKFHIAQNILTTILEAFDGLSHKVFLDDLQKKQSKLFLDVIGMDQIQESNKAL